MKIILKFIFGFMIFGISILSYAEMGTIEIEADSFSEGVGVVKDTQHFARGVKLFGLFFPGYVIYEFPLNPHQPSAGLSVRFENARQQQMDVFVWNYGTRTTSDAMRKENLDSHWILWESTSQGADWQSSRPEYLTLREGRGAIDYLGDENILKLLLYADGGMPPVSDELFYIDALTLRFPTYEEIFKRVTAMDSVWIEGQYLFAKGVGFAPAEAKNPAMGRATAYRAAQLDGYRNLAKAIYGAKKVDNKEIIVGDLKGVTEKSNQAIDNNGIELILYMPLSMIE